MKTLAKTLLSAALATAAFAQSALATEIVHYDNKPVVIELRQGEERLIQFGDHVAVGVSQSQERNQLFRTQSAQGAVLIKPNKEFDRERVQIKRMTDGRVVLLDLVARPAVADGVEPLEDVRVYLDGEDVVEADTAKGSSQSMTAPPAEPITPITLTRYIAQKLYAPARLHKDLPQISEANLNDMSGQEVRAFKGMNRLSVSSTPVLAYRAGHLHVVAILLKNKTAENVTLNYMDINLPFSHATSQHHSLRPMGQAGDRTMLYLVNDRPLSETLVPWTFYALNEGAKQ